MLPMKNKCLFTAACALAFLLAFSLTACDGDDNVSASENDSHEAHCDSLRASIIKPMQPCNDSLEGYFFASRGSNNWILELSPCGASPDIIYYKCENNEWNAVSSTEIPVGAVYVSTADNRDMFQKNGFKECNAENEGLVDSIVGSDGPIEFKHYYKCEQGSWVSDDVGFTCGTTDVQVGQTCLYTTYTRWGSIATAYIYTSDGTWEPAQDILGNCSDENKDYSWVVESDTIVRSYRCIYGDWFDGDARTVEENCAKEKPTDGDTCSYESDDGKMEYYYFVEQYGWRESTYDSKFGYCPHLFDPEYRTIYAKSDDEKYFYCDGGEWLEAGFVPHQYTDPRKEGLTDEEYDVLDLPKDAKVGDRAGGLLEDCWYNAYLEFGDSVGDKYDYCLPRNYYRYRENGSWTSETKDDIEKDSRFEDFECSEENEGREVEVLPTSEDAYPPGEIYKCTSGKLVFVDYNYSRSQKSGL